MTRSRSYRSPRRTQQAQQTRAQVLRAAGELFAERGWSATTLTAVAERAGVAVETIYATFKSKKALLRAAFEASLVGDEAPVPLSERPEYRAQAEGPLHRRVEAGVRVQSAVMARSAGLWRAAQQAAAAEAELAGWHRESERTRRDQIRHGAALVLGREPDGDFVDLLWALYAPDVYLRLIEDRGWTPQTYELWLSRTVTGLLPHAAAD